MLPSYTELTLKSEHEIVSKISSISIKITESLDIFIPCYILVEAICKFCKLAMFQSNLKL